jgi:predicted transcriptional regulator
VRESIYKHIFRVYINSFTFTILGRFSGEMSEITERIRRVEERLGALEGMIKVLGASPNSSQPRSMNMNDLLALPSSLQKTMLTAQDLKEATSSEVAEKTGRDRTVETIYLNQLTRLGYLSKERRGRKIYFKILRYY